jgi:bis(5'-nucleosyl)-tetraphosphatase (symmetrical)
MAIYLLGDLQGCSQAFDRMLAQLSFSPSRDTLYLLGDLVNRGPDSAGVLRRLRALEGAAWPLLGNHDLHALAVHAGVRPPHRQDTLQALLQAPDAPELLHWLRQQPLARQAHGVLMVHAGVLPGWSARQTLALAEEVSHALRAPDWITFLRSMYGNAPNAWDDRLQGIDRLRVIVNALTRLRFCTARGEMEFATKEGAGQAPPGFMPWFDVPGRRTADETVAFGHWSTLGWLGRKDVLSLDTGCVWGGRLSALAIDPAHGSETRPTHTLVQIPCEAAQQSGTPF